MFLFIRAFVYSLQKLNFKKANVKNDGLTLTTSIVHFWQIFHSIQLLSWKPDAVWRYFEVVQVKN